MKSLGARRKEHIQQQEAQQAGDLIKHFLRGGNGGVQTLMETTIMVLAHTKHLMAPGVFQALLDELCLREVCGPIGGTIICIDIGRKS